MKPYSMPFVRRCVDAVRNGENCKQVAAREGADPESIRQWCLRAGLTFKRGAPKRSLSTQGKPA